MTSTPRIWLLWLDPYERKNRRQVFTPASAGWISRRIGTVRMVANDPFAIQESFLLDPVFARTSKLAQYHGVREAARRLHDEHIGLGRVFHLFRLPEEVERDLHRRVEEQTEVESLFDTLAARETALSALATLAEGDREEPAEGPISVGKAKELLTNKAIKEMARCYSAAFKRGIRSYPYVLGDRD